MNKTFLLLLSLMLLPLLAAAEGASMQVTFRVTDDNGKPIHGAAVGLSAFSHWQPGSAFGQDVYKGPTGQTDTNGVVVLKSSSLRGEVSYRIKDLPGYYADWGNDYAFKEVKDGKWQPWNPTVELVLKPVVKPVPMYSKRVSGLSIPEAAKPIGYDLSVGDWVAPYGRGTRSDFNFKFELKQPFTSPVEPFDAVLIVMFSNEDDGIQGFTFSPDRGSTFRSPRHAPESAYKSELFLRKYREEGKPIVSNRTEDQNYFFRVRTVKREGRIVSALYGKVYGNISFDFFHSPTATIAFTYFLNPEPNSRNMEFDPKKNLLKGLKSTERPNVP
jgi:hypothetical protein